MATLHTAADINLLASFLSREDIRNIHSCPPVDCIIICVSQVLQQAEQLFQALEHNPGLTKTLLLVGGKGHSTRAIYDAVAKHPRYKSVAPEVVDLAESRVIELILSKFFDTQAILSQGCKILVEDVSTNCGSNAIEARKVLDSAGVLPKTCVIIQDPNMMLRAIASFEKVYEGPTQPAFMGCPIFVPTMRVSEHGFDFDVPGISGNDLWPKQRFYELLMGEIPRLRDDEDGYGPEGRGFINHITIPDDVGNAYRRLAETLDTSR